jgi:hypothetical protein
VAVDIVQAITGHIIFITKPITVTLTKSTPTSITLGQIELLAEVTILVFTFCDNLDVLLCLYVGVTVMFDWVDVLSTDLFQFLY